MTGILLGNVLSVTSLPFVTQSLSFSPTGVLLAMFDLQHFMKAVVMGYLPQRKRFNEFIAFLNIVAQIVILGRKSAGQPRTTAVMDECKKKKASKKRI